MKVLLYRLFTLRTPLDMTYSKINYTIDQKNALIHIQLYNPYNKPNSTSKIIQNHIMHLVITPQYPINRCHFKQTMRRNTKCQLSKFAIILCTIVTPQYAISRYHFTQTMRRNTKYQLYKIAIYHFPIAIENIRHAYRINSIQNIKTYFLTIQKI